MPLKKSAVDEKLEELRREAEERDAERRATKSGYPYADLRATPINIEALALIPEEKSRSARAAAIELNEQKKEAAVTAYDPMASAAQEVVAALQSIGYTSVLYTVSLSSLNHVWSFYKFAPAKEKQITGAVEIAETRIIGLRERLASLAAARDALQRVNSSDAYTSELLEIVLAAALANRASDIHFEPGEKAVRVRFRIDGLLHDIFTDLRVNVYGYLLSWIKLLSGLRINVRNEPQDGRFSVKLPDKEVELRVAVAPAEFGEVVVMRLLDPDAINLALSNLGLRDDDLKIVELELGRPNGMVLNTGPTGSGKTTTLYAFLKHKKTPEIKIITIEDPIEYRLEGIEQTQVDDEGGYTFANGLRSLMRQDPDVILVGEIRDKETAEIGIQSALTGHLVFSTVHANEAAGAIPRLLDLGVRPSSIGPAVNLVIGQRLVRRLCDACKIPADTDVALQSKIKKFLSRLPERVNKDAFTTPARYLPKGCEKCNQFGYKGRVAIFELFRVDAKVEELINKDTSEARMQEYARESGMVSMQDDGILKVVSGATTFDEVEAATGPIEWDA